MRSAAPKLGACFGTLAVLLSAGIALTVACDAGQSSRATSAPSENTEASTHQARYVAKPDGTVTDRHTGLMWASTDQGSQMPWGSAQTYVEALETGGYDDWRLPTLDELMGLYDSELEGYVPICTKTDLRVKLPESIVVSCGVAWAAEHDFAKASHFNLFYGRHFSVNRSDDYVEGSVALPVRGPVSVD